MENEYEKDTIFPTSYSEPPKCKDNFPKSSSQIVQYNKNISHLDSVSINKDAINFYDDTDDVSNRTLIGISSLYDSSGAVPIIRYDSSNKVNAISGNLYNFHENTSNFEKVGKFWKSADSLVIIF